MEITANQKYLGSTPRKLRLVADMVRKMTPSQAVLTLGFTAKDAAPYLAKAIKTALANAKQQGLDNDKLVFKKIEINEGPKLKRFRAGTRGRAKPYSKKQSHIKIVLTDESNKLETKDVDVEKKGRTGLSVKKSKSTKGETLGKSK